MIMMSRSSFRAALLAVALLPAVSACDSRDSLGPGRTTTDRVAPTVMSIVPDDLATQVPRTGPFTITFSEPVLPASITASSITFSPAVAGTVSYTANTATFTPTAQLAPSTVYVATISTNVEDIAGNHLAAPFTWTFTTAP
jgi:hypothetical protein